MRRFKNWLVDWALPFVLLGIISFGLIPLFFIGFRILIEMERDVPLERKA